MAYAIQNRAVAEKIKRDQRALVNLGHVHQSTKWTHLGNLGAIPANQDGVFQRLGGSTFDNRIKGALLVLYRQRYDQAATATTLKGKTNKSGTYRLGPSDSYGARGTYNSGQAVTTQAQGGTWYKLNTGSYIKKADVGSAFDAAVFTAVFNEKLAQAVDYAVGTVKAVPPDLSAMVTSVKQQLVNLMLQDARIKAMGIGA